jgi:hypothetical protein
MNIEKVKKIIIKKIQEKKTKQELLLLLNDTFCFVAGNLEDDE